MDDPQLLIMMAPDEIRDDIVDSLTACEGISGFKMTTMAGFSKEHSLYDLREQVEGHRQFFKFEVMHSRKRQAGLLAAFGPVCSSAKVRYWIVPVLEQGHL